MAWTVEYSTTALKQLRKLNRSVAQQLVDQLDALVADSEHPRQRGKALKGPLSGLWRYRVGDHRLICSLDDGRMVVLLLRLGHRSDVYR